MNPWRQIDVASLFVPGRVELGEALLRTHPGYMGWSLLALGMMSKRFGWWLVFGFFVMISLGPIFCWAGSATGIVNPIVAAIHWLPGGGQLHHHGRALLISAIALAVLASVGAKRFPQLRWLLLVLVMMENCWLSPVSPVFPVTQPSTSLVLQGLSSLSDGDVLVVPAAGPGISFQQPLWEQRQHQRRLLIDPNRPGIPRQFCRQPVMKWLQQLAFHDVPFEGTVDFPSDLAVLVVERRFVARIQKVMGPPKIADHRFAAWDLQER